MNDGAFEPEYPSIEHVVDLLEAYADARLSPRGAVLGRMRRHVMAEAAARAAAEEDARLRAAIEAAERKRSWGRLVLQRRVAAVGVAAALTFGTSAAVLAAPPGSPFYNARVAIEQALLPSTTDERVAAHERLLAERLAEAQAAAANGDAASLGAALAAYQAEVDAAVADVGSDPVLLAHLEDELAKHTAVLESLAARLPEQAAIEHAIEVSQKATTKLHDAGKPANGGQPGPHPTPAGVPGSGPDRAENANQR
jgi:hypothetical protein